MSVTVTVAGTTLALPVYANIEDAFVAFVPITTGAAQFTYKAAGNFIDVPLGFSGIYATDATVTTRTVVLVVSDENAEALWVIPPIANQTASLTFTYSWTPATSNAYSAGQTLVAPLPVVPLFAGFTLASSVTNTAAGDKWTSGVISLMRIPTMTTGGMERPAPAVPTPILL